MSAIHLTAYSPGLEAALAEYATGDPADRGEKAQYELLLKVQHARGFFEFCGRYVDLSGKRFIEIGCGTAPISVAAALAGATVEATDVVERALSLARLRWGEHRIEGEVFRSDLRDPVAERHRGAFDFVFCYQVIEHVGREHQFPALANLFSMVAPGGFLFIDTENSLCPFDRHDTGTWLIRFLSKSAYDPLLVRMGKGLDFFEPSAGRRVQTRDYLSYDELLGAALVSGLELVSPFMPHGSKHQYLRMLTGSDWLHDTVMHAIDIERYAPISVLFRRPGRRQG